MLTETNLTSNLVIGLGEIGTAIQKILECDGYDTKINKGNFSFNGDPLKELQKRYDIIHICLPYNDSFFHNVSLYEDIYKPKCVVIHSTVPVGTCKKILSNHHQLKNIKVIHSPVRGVHPHLEEGIRTFTKYFGGRDAHAVIPTFEAKGITCVYCDTPETTELMKLVDTTTYGVNILIEKEIRRLCETNNVPFDMVYTHANTTYNQGYAKLNMPYFSKYILKHYDGKIGGHCINENSKLLNSWMNDLLDSPLNS